MTTQGDSEKIAPIRPTHATPRRFDATCEPACEGAANEAYFGSNRLLAVGEFPNEDLFLQQRLVLRRIRRRRPPVPDSSDHLLSFPPLPSAIPDRLVDLAVALYRRGRRTESLPSRHGLLPLAHRGFESYESSHQRITYNVSFCFGLEPTPNSMSHSVSLVPITSG